MSKNSVVGPWAVEKLEHLRKYLHAYATIMAAPDQQRWLAGFHYIDAFAGPGHHEVRSRKPVRSRPAEMMFDVASYAADQLEQRALIAGSPSVALEVDPPFTSYVFIERSSQRAAELERLQSEYGTTRRIRVYQDDCRRILRDKVANNPKIDWKRHRAFVFLDPFGMQVNWSTINQLAETKAIDVLLNFPVGMAIQRLLPRDPIALTTARRKWLDAYFGATDWYDVVYKKERTLFDDVDETKTEKSGVTLLKWYRRRLKSVFGYVSNAALIRNTRPRQSHLISRRN